MDTKYCCWRCGRELMCMCNFIASECGYIDEDDEDNDSIVTTYSCPYCGASYEVIDTPEGEKMEYEYWRLNNIEGD